MFKKKYLILILIVLGISVVAAGCDEGPCMVTGTIDLTVYRLPDPASDVFGILPAGESHEVLARTADGWIGFDPGVAQAGNQGLAHHRWIQLNATLSPFCLVSVPVVTLPEVLADMPAIDPTLPPPPPPDPPAGAANMVITQAIPGAATLVENTYYQVDVTIQNQGDATASGYEMILIPHYGWGPPNPAGQSAVPDLAPGASHTINFSPGLVYSTPGTYTLRIILTDDWYTSTASLDSSGTAGDIKDFEITVIADICNPFENLEPAFVLLNLPPDTRQLPTYMKVAEGIFPGFDPDSDLPNEYVAKLGKEVAYLISQQGFPDRAYFMFNIPEGMEGTVQPFTLWLSDCPEPVYVLPSIQIPVPKPIAPTCSADFNESDCIAAGGDYQRINDKTSTCICP